MEDEKRIALEDLQPGIEEMNIVLIDEYMLAEALCWVSACESCADYAGITFNYLLDAVTGCDPTLTEYITCRPASCPNCSCDITEETLIAVH